MIRLQLEIFIAETYRFRVSIVVVKLHLIIGVDLLYLRTNVAAIVARLDRVGAATPGTRALSTHALLLLLHAEVRSWSLRAHIVVQIG